MQHSDAVDATGILATAAATASALSCTGVEVVTAVAAGADAVMACGGDVDAVMDVAADADVVIAGADVDAVIAGADAVTVGEEGSDMESTLMIGETCCSQPYPDFSGVFCLLPK